MDVYLESLLKDDARKSRSLEDTKNILWEKYDHVQAQIILLYLKSRKLYLFSEDYSKMRMVHGSPILIIPEVSKTLKYSNAMLLMYKNSLLLCADISSICLFIDGVLSDVIERLLQLHGASGYMLKSSATELWLECRDLIARIKEECVYEV